MLGDIVSRLSQTIAHLEGIKSEVEAAMQKTIKANRQSEMVSYLLKTVAEKHGVSVEEIISNSRDFHICRARDEAAYKLKNSGRSNASVGKILGDRDHSTIIAAVRRHEMRL